MSETMATFMVNLDKMRTALSDRANQMIDTDAESFEVGRSFMLCDGQPADKDPRVIGAKVLDFPEHEHLNAGGAAIDYLFRTSEKRKHGRRILGTCYAKPKVQGDLGDLFDDMLVRLLGRVPDFLVILDWEYWHDATVLQREILVHHELMHAGQARDLFGAPRFDRDGMPMWALRDHDLSEFNDTVRRYGVHSEDVEAFLRAITENMEQGA
jgi:hypothetical protein